MKVCSLILLQSPQKTHVCLFVYHPRHCYQNVLVATSLRRLRPETSTPSFLTKDILWRLTSSSLLAQRHCHLQHVYFHQQYLSASAADDILPQPTHLLSPTEFSTLYTLFSPQTPFRYHLAITLLLLRYCFAPPSLLLRYCFAAPRYAFAYHHHCLTFNQRQTLFPRQARI